MAVKFTPAQLRMIEKMKRDAADAKRNGKPFVFCINDEDWKGVPTEAIIQAAGIQDQVGGVYDMAQPLKSWFKM